MRGPEGMAGPLGETIPSGDRLIRASSRETMLPTAMLPIAKGWSTMGRAVRVPYDVLWAVPLAVFLLGVATGLVLG